MQLALGSPVFRSLALGTLLLAATVGGVMAHKSRHHHHLVLRTFAQPGAIYLTAWRHGPVVAPFEGDELEPLVYTTTARMVDGCRWQATETLEPIDAKRYAYRYEEQILSCVEGAEPFVKTPRTGTVTLAP